MALFELQATTREVFGKKVESLRRAGIIPVNVYGHGIESMALQVQASALDKLLSQAETAHLVSLMVNEEKPGRNVMIKEVQRKGGMGKLLHVSFYQVIAKEKIKLDVPIDFVGESPAVKAREGYLMIILRTVEVECLPGSIPSSIVFDISHLSKLGDIVHVKDLEIGKDITLLTGSEQIVVKVEPIRAEAEEIIKKAEAKVEEVEEEKAEEGPRKEER